MKHLPIIQALVIPHEDQKYDTAGDYWQEGDDLLWRIRLSKMPHWKMEALVLLHELVEMCLTKSNGVDWKDIDEFDKNGPGKDSDDPGSLPEAPYHKEHMQATELERQFAEMLGMDWDFYDSALDRLVYKEPDHGSES